MVAEGQDAEGNAAGAGIDPGATHDVGRSPRYFRLTAAAKLSRRSPRSCRTASGNSGFLEINFQPIGNFAADG